jgi:hypothetical protein
VSDFGLISDAWTAAPSVMKLPFVIMQLGGAALFAQRIAVRARQRLHIKKR